MYFLYTKNLARYRGIKICFSIAANYLRSTYIFMIFVFQKSQKSRISCKN